MTEEKDEVKAPVLETKIVTESQLIGDIRGSDPETAEHFLDGLQELMEKFKVDKVDIAWRHFEDDKAAKMTDKINKAMSEAVSKSQVRRLETLKEDIKEDVNGDPIN